MSANGVIASTQARPLSVRLYCLIIMVVAIAVYANTLLNSYALDDRMMIQENAYVKKGISAIPQLLTTTHLRGFLHLPNDKYRPLSLVMFAAEYELAGDNPFLGHLVNVLLFATCAVLTFLFLRRLLGAQRAAISFLAALLFAVHPIHTEVVANIKGRDELLSYFFGLLALLSFMGYATTGRVGRLAAGMLCYLLALMAKENVITFLAIVPLLFLCYVNEHRRRSMVVIGATFAAAAAFVSLAYAVLQLNNTGLPHEASDFTLNALTAAPDAATRYATAVYALGIYLRLLFVPHPLLCNYSYSAIPFVGFDNAWVLLSLLAYGLLLYLGISRLAKKHRDPLAFSILLYLLVMAMFSNLFAMLGSQVAERFLFLPSLGFCLAVALGLEWLTSKKSLVAGSGPTNTQRSSGLTLPLGEGRGGANKKVIAILAPALLLYSGLTIARNAQWKDNATLFAADVEKSPDDCRLNFFMAGQLAPPAGTTNPQAYAGQIDYLRRALAIYPDFIQAHTSLAQVYEATGQYDSAYLHGITALRSKPDNSIATYTTGKVLYAMRRYPEALQWLTATVRLAPGYAPASLNLARCYDDVKMYDSAIVYYRHTLRLSDTSLIARRGIALAFLQTARYDSAAHHMSIAIAAGGSLDDMSNLGAIYLSAGQYRQAITQFKNVIARQPGYTAAHTNLAIAYQQLGLKDSAQIYSAISAHN